MEESKSKIREKKGRSRRRRNKREEAKKDLLSTCVHFVASITSDKEKAREREREMCVGFE